MAITPALLDASSALPCPDDFRWRKEYEACLSPVQRHAIHREAERSAPGSGHKAVATFQVWASEYCRFSRVGGYRTGAFAARTLARAIQDKAARGEKAALPSGRTVERYMALYERAGVIRVDRLGLKGAKVGRVLLLGVLEFNRGFAWHEDRAAKMRVAANEKRRAKGACPPLDDDYVDSLAAEGEAFDAVRPTSVSAAIFPDALKRISGPPEGGYIDPVSDAEVHLLRSTIPAKSNSPHIGPYDAGCPTSPDIKHNDLCSSSPEPSGLPIPECDPPPPSPSPPAPRSTPKSPQAAQRVSDTTSHAPTPERRAARALTNVNIIKNEENAAGEGQGSSTPRAPRPSSRPGSLDAQMWSAREMARGIAQPGALKASPPPPRRLPPRVRQSIERMRPGGSLSIAAMLAAIESRPDLQGATSEHIRRAWTSPAVAFDSLDLLASQGADEGDARRSLPDGVWGAVVAIQPWTAWLEGVDHLKAAEAFDVYVARSRVARAGFDPSLGAPMPDSPEAFIAQAQAYLSGRTTPVGINGVALAALGLSRDQWDQALHATRLACDEGKTWDSRATAGYLLAVAARLANGEA